jgi:hypothetical protein
MRAAGLRKSISSSVISEYHSLGLLTRAVSRFVTTKTNDCFTVWPRNTRRPAIGPIATAILAPRLVREVSGFGDKPAAEPFARE